MGYWILNIIIPGLFWFVFVLYSIREGMRVLQGGAENLALLDKVTLWLKHSGSETEKQILLGNLTNPKRMKIQGMMFILLGILIFILGAIGLIKSLIERLL